MNWTDRFCVVLHVSHWKVFCGIYVLVISAQDFRVLSINYRDERLFLLLIIVYLPINIMTNSDEQTQYIGRFVNAHEQNASDTVFLSDLEQVCNEHAMAMTAIMKLPLTNCTHVNMRCLSRS